MLNVLVWLVAIEAVGLAAFPLCYYLFPRLRDRGISISKPLGLLLIGYLSWILSVLHVLPSVQITVAGLLVAVAGLSWWYLWGRRREVLDCCGASAPPSWWPRLSFWPCSSAGSSTAPTTPPSATPRSPWISPSSTPPSGRTSGRPRTPG